MMRSRKQLSSIIVLLAVLLAAVGDSASALRGYCCAAGHPLAFTQDDKKKAEKEFPDVKLGKENAEELEKTIKLVTDPAILERVNRIGQEIAAIANAEPIPILWGMPERGKFEYTFRVVDDKDINAFSLPGGFIYINKGLLDYVKSDDELAGVIGHEIAHAAHRHMIRLINEQNKLQQRLLIPLIVGALLSRSPGSDIGNLLMAGQLYLVAKLNTYGIEAEKDADQAGVRYLMRTKYNPVGLLTFMERLARDELRGPQRELGIYRTHPPSPERARALQALLEELKIPINRREVDTSIRALVKPATVNGVTVAEVTMGNTVITRLTASDGLSADDRAQKFADNINLLFDRGLQMHELRLSSDGKRIVARSIVMVTFAPSDAEVQNLPLERVSRNTLDVLKNLLWQDQFNRIPPA
jgi:Zn-dependent protease with chaperone function